MNWEPSESYFLSILQIISSFHCALFNRHWLRQGSGRLIKVKYTGTSLGGIWKWSFTASSRLRELFVCTSLTECYMLYNSCVDFFTVSVFSHLLGAANKEYNTIQFVFFDTLTYLCIAVDCRWDFQDDEYCTNDLEKHRWRSSSDGSTLASCKRVLQTGYTPPWIFPYHQYREKHHQMCPIPPCSCQPSCLFVCLYMTSFFHWVQTVHVLSWTLSHWPVRFSVINQSINPVLTKWYIYIGDVDKISFM